MGVSPSCRSTSRLRAASRDHPWCSGRYRYLPLLNFCRFKSRLFAVLMLFILFSRRAMYTQSHLVLPHPPAQTLVSPRMLQPLQLTNQQPPLLIQPPSFAIQQSSLTSQTSSFTMQPSLMIMQPSSMMAQHPLAARTISINIAGVAVAAQPILFPYGCKYCGSTIRPKINYCTAKYILAYILCPVAPFLLLILKDPPFICVNCKAEVEPYDYCRRNGIDLLKEGMLYPLRTA